MNKIDQHVKICSKLTGIYEQKNHDYGDSFSTTMREIGPLSAVTRIGDKYHRLVSLLKKPDSERKVLDESIMDTLLDMANYCIMTAMELEEDERTETRI